MFVATEVVNKSNTGLTFCLFVCPNRPQEYVKRNSYNTLRWKGRSVMRTGKKNGKRSMQRDNMNHREEKMKTQ